MTPLYNRKLATYWQNKLNSLERNLKQQIEQTSLNQAGQDEATRQRMLDRFVQQLYEVRQARQRLKLNTFGRCQRCGYPIPFDRLDIYPTATTCVDCAGKRTPFRSVQVAIAA